jgi:hypothetical protein
MVRHERDHTQYLDGREHQVVLESSLRIGSPNYHMVMFSQVPCGIETTKCV